VNATTPRRGVGAQAFLALLWRDVRVLRKELGTFMARTAMQPLLLLFVFTWVFPKIGQGVGGAGGAGRFSDLIGGGLLGSAVIFQGIQAVALPMVRDFGFTREIEDRVMAPLPIAALALQKVVGGAIQGLLAALVIFPLAALIPATPVHWTIDWPVLLTVSPLAALLGAALGLSIGTRVSPYQIGLVFSLIVVPMTFLGAVYYPWQRLEAIPWLQWAVLLNPLVYMSEGFRVALVPGIEHMPLAAIYGAMIAFTAVFTWLGIRGFERRVLT
jgi:ABC-2 type transport system permease protein